MKHTPPAKPEGYIDRSPRGVARRFGLSAPTIYKEINEGRLQAVKVGKRTVIPPEAEQNWINNLPKYAG